MASIDQIELSASSISSQPISDPSILPSLPRKRNTGRPITTHGNEWLTVPTKLEAAQLECPFIKIADIDWDSAHGVSHNLDPELDEVTRLQRILIPNKPVQRPTRVLPTQKTPDRLPRPGHCSDLFAREDSEYFEFDHINHGEWVRARSIQCKGNKRSRDSKWRLNPTQIVEEIILYFETVAKDLIAAREWKKRHGKGRFKPKAKLWILPQAAFADWAQGIIWLTEPFFAAAPADRANIQILPQDFSITADNPWDTLQISKWFNESGCEDAATMQDLHEAGVFLPFNGDLSSVFVGPAAGLYEKLDIAQETTYDEVKSGLLSQPLMGPHTLPAKYASRNVARIWRDGKIKDRATANLSGPDKTSLHHHAPNAGYSMEDDPVNFPRSPFTSPNMIAFNIAIIATACGEDLVLCKNDWKGFYRLAPSPKPSRPDRHAIR